LLKTVKREYIVTALHVVNSKLLARYPHLENREDEIRSAAGAGIVKAIQEYDESRGYNLFRWLIWAGTYRAIDILRSPSERLLENRKYVISEKNRRFRLINESDYFSKDYYSLDYTFAKKTKRVSDQKAEEEIHKFIMDAIEDMPDDYREVFSCCHVEGYSCKKTAEINKVKTKRVYYINCLVRKRIKEYFETHGKDYPMVLNFLNK